MARLMYENRFILTKKLHREYYRQLYKENGRGIRITSMVLMGLSVVGFMLTIILLKSLLIAAVLLAAALYFALMIPFGYVFREWTDYRGLLREHGAGAIFQIVSFYSDRIHVKVNKTEFDLKYTALSGIIKTDELWVLLFKGSSGMRETLLLWRGGFKGLTDEELKEFFDFIDKKSEGTLFKNEGK
jgi:hypothetical protein